MRVTWLLIGLAAGCGDDEPRNQLHPVDASIDVPIDQPDAGPCGNGRFATGEVVDLDSKSFEFKGVNNLRLTVQGSSASATTAPNGRFELCVPTATGPATFDVVADAAATPRYYDGFVYLDESTLVTSDLRVTSLRAFDRVRGPEFYAERGLVYDATKAHVLVWQGGDIGGPLAVDRAHDAAQAGSDVFGVIQWEAGASGLYVLFPNVDAANSTATLSVDIGGPHTIPLAADQLTLVGLTYFFL